MTLGYEFVNNDVKFVQTAAVWPQSSAGDEHPMDFSKIAK